MRKPPAFYTASLGFGDCICATPTIRKISQVYGQKVRVFSHYPEIFANLPYVSQSDDVKEWITLDKSTQLRQDYDLHYSFWTLGQKVPLSDDRGVEMKHAVMDIRQYHAIDSGFMLKDDELHCDFVPVSERKNFILPDSYVCLHPFKNWPSRTWDQKNWSSLIQMLTAAKIPVVIIGKDKIDEKLLSYLKNNVKGKTDDRVFEEIEGRKTVKIDNTEVIDLTNQTSLSEAWDVVNRAACVVTMDSGILHLAGTTDTWIVQLGSSIDPEFRAPYRKGSQEHKYKYVAGSCKIFCASNMKYYLKEWENGYSGGTPIQSVPLIDGCLERKKTMECHPGPEAAFNAVKEIYDNAKEKYLKIESQKFIEEISARRFKAAELIKIESGSLGDTIGALAAIDAHSMGNQVSVISKLGAETFGKSYPHITFYPHDSEPEFDIKTGTYLLNGIFHNEFKRIFYKFDKPLIQGYAEQLGVTSWERPKIDVQFRERPIKGKYVCFSMHSTAQCKHWNYPNGWDALCRMLRKVGITPVCIDRYESFGIEGHWNKVPVSCVKRQGLTLQEMTNYIQHAEFFIGISSGLSWVAHAMGKPVVMISGVTSVDNEFEENTLRIVNQSVCHGCINMPDKHPFDSGDWLWCPVHKGTECQFECTKTISPEEVFQSIKNWDAVSI